MAQRCHLTPPLGLAQLLRDKGRRGEGSPVSVPLDTGPVTEEGACPSRQGSSHRGAGGCGEGKARPRGSEGEMVSLCRDCPEAVDSFPIGR